MRPDCDREVMTLDNYGFIREKVDIKILVLYILKHLPAPVDDSTLLELTMCDNAINYFDYTECLTELQKTGHITAADGGYAITDFGRDTLKETESSLPYTIRMKAGNAARRAAKVLNREVQTSHMLREDGRCNVLVSLSDYQGQLLRLEILAGSEEQAAEMEQHFREKADALFREISGLLLKNE